MRCCPTVQVRKGTLFRAGRADMQASAGSRACALFAQETYIFVMPP
jgi:hypothetical protein